jgi:bacterioferritin-associated ferredoxin
MTVPVGSGVRVVIVCSCNVISDHQVRSVTAEQAVRATSEVYRCLGRSAACGRCVRTVRHIMDEVLAGLTAAVPESGDPLFDGRQPS